MFRAILSVLHFITIGSLVSRIKNIFGIGLLGASELASMTNDFADLDQSIRQRSLQKLEKIPDGTPLEIVASFASEISPSVNFFLADGIFPIIKCGNYLIGFNLNKYHKKFCKYDKFVGRPSDLKLLSLLLLLLLCLGLWFWPAVLWALVKFFCLFLGISFVGSVILRVKELFRFSLTFSLFFCGFISFIEDSSLKWLRLFWGGLGLLFLLLGLHLASLLRLTGLKFHVEIFSQNEFIDLKRFWKPKYKMNDEKCMNALLNLKDFCTESDIAGYLDNITRQRIIILLGQRYSFFRLNSTMVAYCILNGKKSGVFHFPKGLEWDPLYYNKWYYREPHCDYPKIVFDFLLSEMNSWLEKEFIFDRDSREKSLKVLETIRDG